VEDIKRVWPGPGRQGLELLQVGVSTPIDDIDVPHIAMPQPPQQQPQQQTAAHHTTSTSNTESRFFSPYTTYFDFFTDVHTTMQPQVTDKLPLYYYFVRELGGFVLRQWRSKEFATVWALDSDVTGWKYKQKVNRVITNYAGPVTQ